MGLFGFPFEQALDQAARFCRVRASARERISESGVSSDCATFISSSKLNTPPLSFLLKLFRGMPVSVEMSLWRTPFSRISPLRTAPSSCDVTGVFVFMWLIL